MHGVHIASYFRNITGLGVHIYGLGGTKKGRGSKFVMTMVYGTALRSLASHTYTLFHSDWGVWYATRVTYSPYSSLEYYTPSILASVLIRSKTVYVNRKYLTTKSSQSEDYYYKNFHELDQQTVRRPKLGK